MTTDDELLLRADGWLSEFHNKGGVTVPDDSYLALIRDLAAALRHAEKEAKSHLDAFVRVNDDWNEAEARVRDLELSVQAETKEAVIARRERDEALSLLRKVITDREGASWFLGTDVLWRIDALLANKDKVPE